MAYQNTPKAEMVIDLTPEEYVEASLLAERQGGYLQPLPFVVLVAAGLLFFGLRMLNWFQSNYHSVFFPLFLCVCCPILLVIYFYILPAALKRRAAKSYRTYQTLMQNPTIQLYADYALTEAHNLTLNDSYARMAGCIETPRLFVLIKDRERLLVIPKRCIPQEQWDQVISFIRLVFARRRKVMKSWIF
mgnify:FL=1